MPLPGDQVPPGSDYLPSRLARIEAQYRELAAARRPASSVQIPMYPKAWPSAFLDSANTDLTLPASAATNTVWEGWIDEVTRASLYLAVRGGRATGTSAVPTYSVIFDQETLTPETLGSWSQTGYYSQWHGPYDISGHMGSSGIITLSMSATGTSTDRVACQVIGCYLR